MVFLPRCPGVPKYTFWVQVRSSCAVSQTNEGLVCLEDDDPSPDTQVLHVPWVGDGEKAIERIAEIRALFTERRMEILRIQHKSSYEHINPDKKKWDGPDDEEYQRDCKLLQRTFGFGFDVGAFTADLETKLHALAILYHPIESLPLDPATKRFRPRHADIATRLLAGSGFSPGSDPAERLVHAMLLTVLRRRAVNGVRLDDARYKAVSLALARGKGAGSAPTETSPRNYSLGGNGLRVFMCRMCYSYMCKHGQDFPAPPGDVPPVAGEAEGEEEECVDCPLRKRVDLEEEEMPVELNADSVDALQVLSVIYRADYCKIGRILGRSCLDCFRVCQQRGFGGDQSKKDLKCLALVSTNKTNFVSSPCLHAGPCLVDNGCSCAMENRFCEKYCACDRPYSVIEGRYLPCENSFKGCSCRRGICSADACACHGHWRECDPDVCKGCGEACSNQMITSQRKRKRTLIGSSLVHGYGLFASEPIKKGDFVGEYVGEHLLEKDVNERDIITKVTRMNYVFDQPPPRDKDGGEVRRDQSLNFSVVDSLRKGSRVRFVNDSSGQVDNLEIRTRYTRGDFRIGMFATKAIAPGQELFFTYGDRFWV